MKKSLTVLGITLGLWANQAWAEQKVQPNLSEIAFTSRQMGVPVDGKFRKFDAQVAFDPKKPDTSKVSFAIDLGSVSVGGPETEAEIAKAEWFDTSKFPQAKFESTQIRALSNKQFEVQGKLSIKGISQSIMVPVTLTQTLPNTTASGSFVIQRLDFKLGNVDWKDTSLVANEVQVKFKLVLSGVPAI